MRLIRVSCLIMLGLFTNGCIAPHGVRRTPIHEWVLQTYPDPGFQIEIPRNEGNTFSRYFICDVTHSRSREGKQFSSYGIRMNPYWSGSIIQEPHYFLEINVQIFDYPWDMDSHYSTTPNILRMQEDVVDHRPGVFLDKWCNTTKNRSMLIQAWIWRLSSGDSPELRQDIETSTRILNSVKPLPPEMIIEK